MRESYHVEELDASAAWKVRDLKEHDDALEKREEVKALAGSEKTTKEEFNKLVLWCTYCEEQLGDG